MRDHKPYARFRRVPLYLLATACLGLMPPAMADSFMHYDEYSNPQGITAEVHTNMLANTFVHTIIPSHWHPFSRLKAKSPPSFSGDFCAGTQSEIMISDTASCQG